jgi:hypothetical protein
LSRIVGWVLLGQGGLLVLLALLALMRGRLGDWQAVLLAVDGVLGLVAGRGLLLRASWALWAYHLWAFTTFAGAFLLRRSALGGVLVVGTDPFIIAIWLVLLAYLLMRDLGKKEGPEP